MRHQLDAARQRSERAASMGDRAGSIIAAGDARAILRRMIAAAQSDHDQRTRRTVSPWNVR